MFTFVFGGLICLASIVGYFVARRIGRKIEAANKVTSSSSSNSRRRNNSGADWDKAAWLFRTPVIVVATFLLFCIGIIVTISSTARYVYDNQGAIVIVHFGSDLPSDRIVATNGEKGPQAQVLSPGWKFWYWPWQYDLKPVDNFIVPTGSIGVVTALDGQPLPAGEVYAMQWDDPQKMMDAQFFLTTKKVEKVEDGPQGPQGYEGPQLTVLPPATYRYNPRLYKIELRPVLTVRVGEVAVVKANAGPIYTGDDVEFVNGVPIVPKGFRGIWREPLTPNQYYMHPDAYEITMVQVTNRIFQYTEGGGNSIRVRSNDGFAFPVDVRVSVKVPANKAPLVVAQLGNPDAQASSNSPYIVLEERVVLPLIRAIFRNTAEQRPALNYVTERSQVEAAATELFNAGLAEFGIITDGVFIAGIGLDRTPAGQELLKTQTDRQVAQEQKVTYDKMKEAEDRRATVERAREQANQEKFKAEAEAQVAIAEQKKLARIAEATGEAEAYRLKIEAIGGTQNYVVLEAIQQMAARWQGDVPEIFVAGGTGQNGAPGMEAMILRMLQQSQEKKEPQEGGND